MDFGDIDPLLGKIARLVFSSVVAMDSLVEEELMRIGEWISSKDDDFARISSLLMVSPHTDLDRIKLNARLDNKLIVWSIPISRRRLSGQMYAILVHSLISCRCTRFWTHIIFLRESQRSRRRR